ncbi:MAG TPA: hypothetical protein VFL91_12540 [Thermomicrobiales bacterium]|nr:hypothetical protein [Thermomicrobiales bacterium]
MATATWPAPAAITYGTPLGDAQLDATANTPGTFIFTVDGTPITQHDVEWAGQHTLSLLFIPADQIAYKAPR